MTFEHRSQKSLGTRVTVGMLVGQIGAGRTIDELLADYPYLEREDVLQALRPKMAYTARDSAMNAPHREVRAMTYARKILVSLNDTDLTGGLLQARRIGFADARAHCGRTRSKQIE